MKKVLSMMICLLMVFSLTGVFAEDVLLIAPGPSAHPARVVDEADLLTDDEESMLMATLDGISQEHLVDVVVVTVDSTGEKTPMEYADDYFDYNGYGFGENFDGVILLVSMEYSDWWIST